MVTRWARIPPCREFARALLRVATADVSFLRLSCEDDESAKSTTPRSGEFVVCVILTTAAESVLVGARRVPFSGNVASISWSEIGDGDAPGEREINEIAEAGVIVRRGGESVAVCEVFNRMMMGPSEKVTESCRSRLRIAESISERLVPLDSGFRKLKGPAFPKETVPLTGLISAEARKATWGAFHHRAGSIAMKVKNITSMAATAQMPERMVIAER